MEECNVYGLDIAKNVFHVCRTNRAGRVIERKRLMRSEVLEYFARSVRGLVGIESCGGSSYWAREIAALGHEVKLVPAQYVKPYVESQKNDTIDAEAIAEAVTRPTMRFVSPNTHAQQDIQNVHRVRERLVRDKVALVNQVHGLLLEYGIAIPQGAHRIVAKLSELLADSESAQRTLWKQVFSDLRDEFLALDERIKRDDLLIKQISRAHPVCKELEKLCGVGPTTSTAILAAVNNPRDFKNGRQFSAWLGVVPKQRSTGGKHKLLGITKRGDKYIRYLLVRGARVEVRFAAKRKNVWLGSVT